MTKPVIPIIPVRNDKNTMAIMLVNILANSWSGFSKFYYLMRTRCSTSKYNVNLPSLKSEPQEEKWKII